MILRLHGATFTAPVGHTKAERRTGCRVEVDVEVTLPDAAFERLQHTLDYRALHALVRDITMGREHPLIEGLCKELAEGILAREDVECVTVRVRKPAPPIPDFSGHAEAELRLPR